MKRFVLMSALIFAAAMTFASGQTEGTQRKMWEDGTQVTKEVKTLTGKLIYADRILPVFVVGNVEYELHAPLHLLADLKVKNGETAEAEGVVMTITDKDGKVRNIFRPLKGKIGTQEFDFSDMMGSMPGSQGGRMGHPGGRGPQNGSGPGPGY